MPRLRPLTELRTDVLSIRCLRQVFRKEARVSWGFTTIQHATTISIVVETDLPISVSMASVFLDIVTRRREILDLCKDVVQRQTLFRAQHLISVSSPIPRTNAMGLQRPLLSSRVGLTHCCPIIDAIMTPNAQRAAAHPMPIVLHCPTDANVYRGFAILRQIDAK